MCADLGFRLEVARTQRSLVDKQRERLKAELSRIDKMIKSSGKILVGQKGEISANKKNS